MEQDDKKAAYNACAGRGREVADIPRRLQGDTLEVEIYGLRITADGGPESVERRRQVTLRETRSQIRLGGEPLT